MLYRMLYVADVKLSSRVVSFMINIEGFYYTICVKASVRSIFTRVIVIIYMDVCITWLHVSDEIIRIERKTKADVIRDIK